ncbi:MAG: hypothetical protein M0Z85_05680 [Gammaproteobacteria bacterium]|nr:hypothetical protein [Gammaproteobacteria bacterium]
MNPFDIRPLRYKALVDALGDALCSETSKESPHTDAFRLLRERMERLEVTTHTLGHMYPLRVIQSGGPEPLHAHLGDKTGGAHDKESSIITERLESISQNPAERFAIVASHILEQGTVTLWSLLDHYLYDLAGAILRNRTDLLRGESWKVYGDDILEASDYDSVMSYLAGSALEGISRKGFNGYLNFLKRSLDVNVRDALRTVLPEIQIIQARRDAIVHHDGLISEDSYSDLGYQREDIGGKIFVDYEWLAKSIFHVFKAAKIIDLCAMEKFGPEFLVR